MSKGLIRNIGIIVSGDLESPFCDGDAVLIVDGKIAAVGREKELDAAGADTIIDAMGTTLIPGLIDSHIHPVFGDFTPRQRTVDFLDSELNGGVTTMISAGEVHTPGRPRDIVGLKALAIAAQRAYANFRPSGAKIMAGAPVPEPGMEEQDFADLARAGVTLIGEIGLGGVRTPDLGAPMVKWAKKHGMMVTIHTGGPSLPGSSAIDAAAVIEIDPHIVGHINGGTTSMSKTDIDKLVRGTTLAIEIVHCGNPLTALYAIEAAMDAGAVPRVIIGNDAPSGTGVVPLGILRTLCLLTACTSLPPEQAVALAAGNTAKLYKLNRGLIGLGREADLVLCDAPSGSVGKDAIAALKAGDIPGISMVMTDGVVRTLRSRNTPPAARAAKLEKGSVGGLLGGH
ncbi:MAG: amidohydrolase family protein [Candidatus Tectomicrobia bacterium]|uniref:Amidohydrolase family protein n=1 Tax=Tectimicrobiota bacterium TaxID=2528274 RepID=A0A932GP90_UNCTE|nr:amidohydrolase family protein [Candidatus Tectomicrobia bacterium]